jgi:hypothetical protein
MNASPKITVRIVTPKALVEAKFSVVHVMVDNFTCEKCGRITMETDYHRKDWNLYYRLKKFNLCEECARQVP